MAAESRDRGPGLAPHVRHDADRPPDRPRTAVGGLRPPVVRGCLWSQLRPPAEAACQRIQRLPPVPAGGWGVGVLEGRVVGWGVAGAW